MNSVDRPEEPSAQEPARPSASLGARLALVFGTVLVTLALIELALSIADAWPPPGSPVEVREVAPGRAGVFLLGDDPDGEGALVAKVHRPPPSGTRRVVFIGDSTIYGTHVRQHATIPAFFERFLSELTSSNWQAVNLGREGIDARTVRLLGEAALEHLQLDLLVVYTGHNEFLPPKVAPFAIAREAPVRAALARWLGWSRIGRALAPGLRGAEPEKRQADRVRSAHLDGIAEHSELADLRPAIQENYARQVTGVVRAADRRGVPVILAGPTSDGREYGPIGSAFSKPLSATERARYHELLRAAYDALHAGQLDACDAALDEAGELDPGVAEWMHLRAALAWERGDGQAARRFDLMKWDLDESPHAASLELLELLEQTARETGATFVELGPVLERVPRPGEPRIFLDNVHPSVYGQYLIARELAVAAAELLEPALEAGDELRGRVESYDRACAALEIPPSFLEKSEDIMVMGDLNYATWSIDPRPYIERARAVMQAMPEHERSQGKFLVAGLYLAILDEDAEQAIACADELVRTRGAQATGLMHPLQEMPRLHAAIERAGLELTDTNPPRLRKVP